MPGALPVTTDAPLMQPSRPGSDADGKVVLDREIRAATLSALRDAVLGCKVRGLFQLKKSNPAFGTYRKQVRFWLVVLGKPHFNRGTFKFSRKRGQPCDSARRFLALSCTWAGSR